MSEFSIWRRINQKKHQISISQNRHTIGERALEFNKNSKLITMCDKPCDESEQRNWVKRIKWLRNH